MHLQILPNVKQMSRHLEIFKSKEELTQLYQELGTVAQVARFLDIPVGRVYYLCSKLGVSVHHGGIKGHSASPESRQLMGVRALARIKAGKQTIKAHTGIELEVGRQLREAGIRSQSQFAVHYLDDLGVRRFTLPDFFIAPTICVYVDGCFWHNCPDHFSNYQDTWIKYRRQESLGRTTHSVLKGTLKEALRDSQLTEQGFMVVRIWEHEVASGIRIKYIQEMLSALTSST